MHQSLCRLLSHLLCVYHRGHGDQRGGGGEQVKGEKEDRKMHRVSLFMGLVPLRLDMTISMWVEEASRWRLIGQMVRALPGEVRGSTSKRHKVLIQRI